MNRAGNEPVILHAMDFLHDITDSTPGLPVLTVSELNRMARRALESRAGQARAGGGGSGRKGVCEEKRTAGCTGAASRWLWRRFSSGSARMAE